MKPVRSVERAITILFLVARGEHPLGLTEIARAAGLDKATTLRLLQTLELFRLVWRDPKTRQYSPGANLWRLPKSWRSDLREVARPYLEELRRVTEETVTLVCPRGLERIVVEVYAGPHELSVVPSVGSAAPIYAGASGKVIMAFMPKAERERVLELTDLKPVSPTVTTDRAAYLALLDEVRAKGYACSVGDVTVGAAAVAAPVFDASGAVVATVSLRGPEVRMTEERMQTMAPLVVQAAKSISRELGHQIEQRATA